jgi:hypothetical protein
LSIYAILSHPENNDDDFNVTKKSKNRRKKSERRERGTMKSHELEDSPSNLRKSASQNLKVQSHQMKPIYKYSDDNEDEFFPPQIQRNETGDFPSLEEDRDLNYRGSPLNAEKNVISMRYKAPDNFIQNEPSIKRNRQFDDSS